MEETKMANPVRQTSQSVRAILGVGLLASGIAVPVASAAEDAPSLPVIPTIALEMRLDSGVIEPPRVGPAVESVVFATVVDAGDAAWVRLWLDGTQLGGDSGTDGSRLRITSLLDGAQQHLTAETLAAWNDSTAYFNGGEVLVELIALPGAAPSRVRIVRAVAQPATPFEVRSLCGVDDRALSADPRAARFMPSGCTAWLHADANRTFLTAGHCGVGAGDVVQFNVPLSTTTGALVNPPPEHQYPVEPISVQFSNGGVGNDYAYFGVSPNSETGLMPFQRQNAAYVLAAAAPGVTAGQRIDITGYGTVTSPVDRRWNQVQKTHVGPYTGLFGTTVRYTTDTTGGNSGSAVLNVTDNTVIGIHSHAGCGGSTGANQGTAIQLAGLQTALRNPRGACSSGIGVAGGDLYVIGDVNNALGTLATNGTAGRFAATHRFNPPASGLSYDPVRVGFFATTHGGIPGQPAGSRLVFIDNITGAVRTIGPVVGTTQIITGLAFDPADRALYGIAGASGQLFEIDQDSGAARAIGPAGGGQIGALEYDPSERDLLALDDSGGVTRLVRIATGLGTRTSVGPLGAGIGDCNGLALLDGVLYTINAATDQVLQIDPLSGAATVVGPTGGLFGANFGLAAVTNRGCLADMNLDGGLSTEDLLIYLELFERGDVGADVDDGSSSGTLDRGVGTEDLLHFLMLYGSC